MSAPLIDIGEAEVKRVADKLDDLGAADIIRTLRRVLTAAQDEKLVLLESLGQARSSLTASGCGSWQPIETAPAKGPFLIWFVGLPWPGYADNGHIYSNAHGLMNELEPGESRIRRTSHWMPLPGEPST